MIYSLVCPWPTHFLPHCQCVSRSVCWPRAPGFGTCEKGFEPSVSSHFPLPLSVSSRSSTRPAVMLNILAPCAVEDFWESCTQERACQVSAALSPHALAHAHSFRPDFPMSGSSPLPQPAVSSKRSQPQPTGRSPPASPFPQPLPFPSGVLPPLLPLMGVWPKPLSAPFTPSPSCSCLPGVVNVRC